jgi:E3 ubiquitin-protein ligase HUWE1
MDKILRDTIQQYPHLLLIAPLARTNKLAKDLHVSQEPAKSVHEVECIPTRANERILAILEFWEVLLRNSTSKALFASVDECVDLLAAANDEIADAALQVLQALSLPPALHKQQAPEAHANATALHNGKASALARLTLASKGYGSRALGLGFYQLLTYRQSVQRVHFSFYPPNDESPEFKVINLEEEDILLSQDEHSGAIMASSSNSASSETSKKRRRVTAESGTREQLTPRSTAELFFLALERGGGREQFGGDARLFSLLCDIRWARGSVNRKLRIQAVHRRLSALICILNAHPSQDVMSGYFSSQPELCAEIVDLLRPTVSSAHVSAAAAADSTSRHSLDGIAGLADTQVIPFHTRMLALEALSALVSRRDNGTSLTDSTRLPSVLAELGVGKGQYLGLLPTLIRYALASLGSVSASEIRLDDNTDAGPSEPISPTFDIGLAFLEATMPAQPRRIVQVKQALVMIDSILTLTSSIVATPSGTTALTDCGLIPALLTTVTVDTDIVLETLMRNTEGVSPHELSVVKALLRFVTAQAIQILEGAVVTNINALTSFHDLDGVDVLTSRLSREIHLTVPTGCQTDDLMDVDPSAVNSVEDADTTGPRICPSQRVLLFSIVTCLTVVFHQESSTSTVDVPSSGAQLRKPELANALVHIMDDVCSFGGHLASLICTLLTDVMNNDPHIVHYIHESGIANSFLKMVMGKTKIGDAYEPSIPPVAELIMAIPNVVAALALTEAGAKIVQKINPFPSLMQVFYHPKYAMPNTRCLLNEITSIVGTGLDEIMRHEFRLKPQVLVAISDAMVEVIKIADALAIRENQIYGPRGSDFAERTAIEDERTCLIQYVLNLGQLLEQILHNEDHCVPFVDAGGLEALLRLFPASMTSGFQFLTNASSLSSLSVSTLHHSTVEESLSMALKCIQCRYEPLKLLQKILDATAQHLDEFEEAHRVLFGPDQLLPFALDSLPRVPFYKLSGEVSITQAKAVSAFLKSISLVQWITCVLSTSIKALTLRSHEGGNGWSSSEREWKGTLSNARFGLLAERLSAFYQSSLFEVCRARTEPSFDEADKQGYLKRSKGLLYRLRIVCPEGAVVRDGVEIDSCANIGSMEMGEIVNSFDRCINSSGILRYHTKRGWVSEMTRGHGREPIAEVISILEIDDIERCGVSDNIKRIEASILDLRAVAIGVLARGQTAYSELFASLSKLSVQGVRSLPVRSISFDEGSAGEHVSSVLTILSSNIERGLNEVNVVQAVNADPTMSAASMMSMSGAAMYYACILKHLQACLFEDRRERRMVNLPLLVSLFSDDPNTSSVSSSAAHLKIDVLGACSFVFAEGFKDLFRRSRFKSKSDKSAGTYPLQRVGKSVAASFPPLYSFLRRLVSTPLSSSPVASVMSRLKWKDILSVLGNKSMGISFIGTPLEDDFFEPERFVKGLQLAISRVVREAWSNPEFIEVPPHLVHPMVNLIGDIIAELDDASKKKISTSRAHPVGVSEGGFNLTDYIRHRARQNEEVGSDVEPEDATNFEVDETTITLMAEMGFDRDRALDALESTRTNRVDVAMEYALTHPPPSPSTIERRRARDNLQLQRAELQIAVSNEVRATHQDTAPGDSGSADAQTGGIDVMDMDEPVTEMKLNIVDENIAKAKAELDFWLEQSTTVCCRILESVDGTPPQPIGKMESLNGDAEIEALTFVLSSFLLGLCQRYPDRSPNIVGCVVQRLNRTVGKLGSLIPQSVERSTSALCHAAVLLVRALPKTRAQVLMHGLVTSLVYVINEYLKSDLYKSRSFPMWLTPSLLLLDVMAQPVVKFADSDATKRTFDGMECSLDKEYFTVKDEHDMQAKELTSAMKAMFSLFSSGRATGKLINSSISSTLLSDSTEVAKEKNASFHDKDTLAPSSMNEATGTAIESIMTGEDTFSLESIPAYFPLLPLELVESCLDLCLALLGVGHSCDFDARTPPGVTHATLSLLLRLLRAPKNSSRCRRLGAAEAILGLSGESKFTGNTGLVALVFRRLLEDEQTLQAATETEIKVALTKLETKIGSSAKGMANVTLHAFIEAVAPLLCRDPLTFLKAMALTVKVEPPIRQSSHQTVALLSAEERVKRVPALLAAFSALNDIPDNIEGFVGQSLLESKCTVKTPHKKEKRSSLSKKFKKDKHSAQKINLHNNLSAETPATHIISLLINAIISSSLVEVSNNEKFEKGAFLWIGSLLEITGDLILAVPACASAVHNYRPRRNKDKSMRSQLQHALSGCANPPKSFVSFLLHSILPQDRWTIKNDALIWERRKGLREESQATKDRRAKAFHVTKLSQSTARVLLALVARPGEGRKRVIAELAFAMSGGRLGHGSTFSVEAGKHSSTTFNVRELHALLSWGEFCVGVIAPRSSSKNTESMSLLSVENIKLLLDHGMVHAILYALNRVQLFHPMAPATSSALLSPLECLTRPAAVDAVKLMVRKCDDTPMKAQNDALPSTSNEVEAHLSDMGYMMNSESSDHSDEEGTGSEDVDLDDELDESDDAISSSDGSSEGESEASEMEDEEDSGDDEEDNEVVSMEESDDVHSEEVEDDGDWNVNYDDEYIVENQESPDIEDDDENTDHVGQALDDGWTRIESAGFGGLASGGRRNPLHGDRSRAQGFVDAAEAMIGSLLRSGDISSERLTELEGSLGGIRVGSNRSFERVLNDVLNPNRSAAARALLGDDGPLNQRQVDNNGTSPYIHQRTQPDVGCSAFGNGGRRIEVSSMEYVFGGPNVTAGCRNYDLISAIDDVCEIGNQPNLTQLDLQIFPGGPALALSVRTYNSLHPLLCGVELPPVNSLVSDLLPHGTIATRLAHMATPWTGTPLVSTSTGNIIRSNRTNLVGSTLGGLPSRNVATPVRLTDDGLPVEEFSSAFEMALAGVARFQNLGTVTGEHVSINLNNDANLEEATNVDCGGSHEDTRANEINAIALQDDSPSADGDGDRVAASLAEGLRLSSDGSVEAVETEEPDAENATGLGNVHMSDDGNRASETGEEVSLALACADAPSNEDVQDVTDVTDATSTREGQQPQPTNNGGLACPPDIDPEVFSQLPVEMQYDCVNQYNSNRELAEQLSGSTLDPEVLAALPEDMRLEVIEQDRQDRRMREQAQTTADPSHAEEMDNASFIASLAPELREEILLQADEQFLSSLPPNIVAEAQILRERASVQQRRMYDEALTVGDGQAYGGNAARAPRAGSNSDGGLLLAGRRKPRIGKCRAELDRDEITYVPDTLSHPFAKADIVALIRLLFLQSPVRPSRLLQKFLLNLFGNPEIRTATSTALVKLLHEDYTGCRKSVNDYEKTYSDKDTWRKDMDSVIDFSDFPPTILLGTTPDIPDLEGLECTALSLLKPNPNTLASAATNLPRKAGISNDPSLPPVVATRIVEALLQLCKSSPRFCLHTLMSTVFEDSTDGTMSTCFEQFLDLLDKPMYSRSSSNLDQLLSLLEAAASPLSQIPKHGEDEIDVSQRELTAASAAGKEWVEVPRVTVSQARLQMLCSILRMETCRDSSFTKVNTIVRRLCRVDLNRGFVLSELASVAHALGADAVRDLRALKIRMDSAARQQHLRLSLKAQSQSKNAHTNSNPRAKFDKTGHISSSVTLSTSSSELKLLRVLQTLQALCGENWEESGSKKNDGSVIVTEELVHLLRQLEFGDLWDELSSCLAVVQVLEGVKALEDEEKKDSEDMETNDDDENADKGKKLRNSAAGLLTRFLPAIEAFFVANASATRPKDNVKDSEPLSSKLEDTPLDHLVDGARLMDFVATNRVLLNALVRNNSSLLDKGLRALVQVPRCRPFLDFDVKRQFFKTQLRRLRQHASRRHGSLRLHIRRKAVFEDAYHQLRLHNADEMRGRLHITFRNEEGVDAGGLSREFFGILAKEIFNPNYALFTSTEDGCTFQPNPNSSINPDHLSYFRFVGRIVGKAVADGFLLDAHFTRSLYKHMLGIEPTHHDMEAIDPDYYRNLQTILEFNLADIGLELTFSIEDHSFGRSHTIDLIPNGRNTHVTEENKDEYVRMVCQHRMTTSIQAQIKSYLDGFYELVSPELIAIFTPRELELLISGLPDIDVHDLKLNTEYVGWKATDKEIEWFWNILSSLSRNEKASFLQFVTGSSKVPLSGFGELQGMRGIQKFSVHKVSGKTGSLMSAHTCFNALDLPDYKNEEEMREKLLYSINEGGGAFLFA